ncbi:MAG: hypothetical protein JWM68_5865 [Verrucomicrobiales bacterium]|nr:hypothetical protein [Verrucomicrobiales bacterium]
MNRGILDCSAKAVKATFFIVLLTALCLAGCGKHQEQKLPSKSATEIVLKVSVLQSGKLLADGTEVRLDELDGRLSKVKSQKGIVWYYRENGQGEPPTIAIEVIKLVMKHSLPISMSSKPDFSDTIDNKGNSQPRK